MLAVDKNIPKQASEFQAKKIEKSAFFLSPCSERLFRLIKFIISFGEVKIYFGFC